MANLSRLSNLTPGQTATVQAIHVDTGFKFRLNALGFRIGKPLELIRIAHSMAPIT